MKTYLQLLSVLYVFFAPYILHASEIYIDFSDIDFSQDTDNKIKNIKSTLKESEYMVKAINFSHNKLDSISFGRITEEVFPGDYSHLTVINLEDNYINEDSANSLAFWLKSNSRPFINLTDNPVSLKNIKKLYHAFLRDHAKEETQDFMKRVIFMSKGYINKAKQNVKVYKELADSGVIPMNWDHIHRHFYAQPEYTALITSKDIKEKQVIVNKMRMVSSACSSKNIISKIIPDEPLESSDEENFLPDSVLIQSLKNLSLNS